MHDMNRFEDNQATEFQATKENKQQLITSRRINFSKEYQQHINDGLEAITELVESPLYPADKDRIVYMGATETATNAAYNLDITHSQDQSDNLSLESLTITAFGGVAADPAIYNYQSSTGEFTKKTSPTKAAEAVSLDEVITRLADDYPNNEQLQSLLDTPTVNLDRDFVVYILENSLVDYAEQSGADKAHQARYKKSLATIAETEDGLFPVDFSNELIVTTTSQGYHYQLDVDSPADPSDPVTRKSINYQVSRLKGVKNWKQAGCTTALRSTQSIPAQKAQQAIKSSQNDTYFELLQAIDNFTSQAPTQELL